MLFQMVGMNSIYYTTNIYLNNYVISETKKIAMFLYYTSIDGYGKLVR